EGGRIVVTATMDAGWHLYSTTMKEGGPFVTKIELLPGKSLTAVGTVVQPPPERKQDPNFNMETEIYEGAVAFGLPVKVPAGVTGEQKAAVRVNFQVCTDRLCNPPKKLEIPVTFTVA